MKFPDRESGSFNYLKLESGGSVRCVFKGDTFNFRQHWKNNKGVVCVGYDECQICHEETDDAKSSFRFKINIIIKENEAYTAKIFEQGGTVYDVLSGFGKDGYDFDTHLFKITRLGSGKDTKYQISPVPNGTLTPAQLEAIAKVPLIPLTKVPSAEVAAIVDVETHGTDDEIPF